MRDTHLRKWLRAAGMTRIELVRDLGLSKSPIYFLAAPDGKVKQYVNMRFDVLEVISRRTGIPPGVLVEDAMQWGEDHSANQNPPTTQASPPAQSQATSRKEAGRDPLEVALDRIAALEDGVNNFLADYPNLTLVVERDRIRFRKRG